MSQSQNRECAANKLKEAKELLSKDEVKLKDLDK